MYLPAEMYAQRRPIHDYAPRSHLNVDIRLLSRKRWPFNQRRRLRYIATSRYRILYAGPVPNHRQQARKCARIFDEHQTGDQ